MINILTPTKTSYSSRKQYDHVHMETTERKLKATELKQNYQATECEDVQAKAEDHGINPVIVHDSL